MSSKLDLIGRRFHKLVVIAPLPATIRTRWLTRCDCGAEKAVSTIHLTQGKIRSCGCINRERMRVLGRANRKHGGGTSPEYRSYSMMRYRCLVPKAKSFPDYGGRGIKICQRWLDSFEAFRDDMGPRPPGTTLDRINNDGDYEPGNCRWATKPQQAQNTRATRHVTINGATKPLRDWIAGSRWERSTIYKRLKQGMSIEEALR